MPEDLREHQRRAERIEQLLEEVAAFPDPQARATTEELIQALLEMYGEGFARILEVAAGQGEAGQALTKALLADEVVGALLLLHGVNPMPLEERVLQALDEVRPYLKSHGGNVEFVGIEEGVAYLRLQGSCHGCPSSSMTLKLAIEEAVYKAAPDLLDLRVEGVTEPPIPVTFIPRKRKDGSTSAEPGDGWSVVAGLGSLAEGVLKVQNVEREPLLFCRVAGSFYAYRSTCSGCQGALADGRLEGTTLICAVCGLHYDVIRAGRCLDAPDLFLEPVPLLVEGDKVKVAMSAPAEERRPTTNDAAAKIRIHSA